MIVELRISDLGEIVTGNTPPTSDRSFYDGEYPLIMPTDIVEGTKYIGETVETISKKGFEKYKKSLIPKNTPCVVTIGSIGKKICLSKEDSFTNQAINAIKVNTDKYDPIFVFYLLKYNLPQVKNLSSGTASGRENVSKTSFGKIKVKLPNDLKAQQKIASILSAYDDLIENNNQRIKLLEEMAEEIYKEWFVRLRFPATADSPGYQDCKFIDKEGNEVPHGTTGALPEGWRNVTIEEVTDLVKRGISPNYDENGNTFVINQRCIRERKINLNVSRRQSKKIPDEKLVRFGDILVNSTGEGTLGRIAQVYDNHIGVSVDTHVTIIRGRKDINIDFFGISLLLKQITFENLAFGSTGQTELSRDDIQKVKIVLAKQELMDNYGSVVAPMRSEIQILLKKNQTLKETRDLLLPRLISGKLDVSNIPDL